MPEIIQQWQYLGKVHPKLLEDKAFENCKKIGITSLQSYLYWAEIEKEKGKIDFSLYDSLVEKLRKHNLKWVPFLILGPNYATPKWFQESKESVFAKCLEHQKESKIQSIWNPNLPKWVERFLKLVSEHYQENLDIIESITLGISGNWGEAIYPAEGGFYHDFHTHPGWWCGDQYARENFANFLLEKYSSLEKLNKAWATNFNTLSEISFPSIDSLKLDFLYSFLRKLPKPIKTQLKLLKKYFTEVKNQNKPQTIKQSWLDFVDWYLGSMTNWAKFWLKTARKYFPNTKIYLVTGGIGDVISGADFSAQVKLAAKYNIGIRITNQTNDYPQSFILTRLVSSAARFYDTPFITEEAAVLQSPEGVTMRIFDAQTSGASGIYCKNFISTGEADPCVKNNLPAGELTEGAGNLTKNLHYFTNEKPIIKVAVFFPNTSIFFNPDILFFLYNRCAKLRDILDFDLVDEKMIKDGALNKYQYLLVLEGKLPEFKLPENLKIIFNPKEINNEIDSEYDRVYATRFENKILYYNSNNKRIRKKVDFLNKTIEIEANSILAINL